MLAFLANIALRAGIRQRSRSSNVRIQAVGRCLKLKITQAESLRYFSSGLFSGDFTAAGAGAGINSPLSRWRSVSPISAITLLQVERSLSSVEFASWPI